MATKQQSGTYRPMGELSGDTKSMPDKGTSTGVSDTYGADLSVDATNSHGGMGRDTKSDGMEMA